MQEGEDACSGNGYCVPFKGCKCYKGFKGENCEIAKIHICADVEDYCVNGECDDKDGCECDDGWYGERCDIAAASCDTDPNPCSGVGECDKVKGCICPGVSFSFVLMLVDLGLELRNRCGRMCHQ